MSFHRNVRGHDLHAPSQELIENNTGATIPKMKVVALDGVGTAFPQVKLANPAQFFNFGIAHSDIASGKYGYAICLGFMFEVNTSPWPVGTVLYSSSIGDLQNTPNGAAMAIVIKQDSNLGVLYVTCAGGGGVHAWDVNGNDGLDPDANFLGTRDLVPLKFRTNNTQVGQWDTNGRFAIGAHNPLAPLHIKPYPNYSGSGLRIDSFCVTSDTLAYVPAYTITLANNQVMRVKFQVTARQSDGSARASFTRSVLIYKEGGNVSIVGPDWGSDFTAKSNNAFEVDYALSATDITFTVLNASGVQTYWSGHVEMELISGAA